MIDLMPHGPIHMAPAGTCAIPIRPSPVDGDAEARDKKIKPQSQAPTCHIQQSAPPPRRQTRYLSWPTRVLPPTTGPRFTAPAELESGQRRGERCDGRCGGCKSWMDGPWPSKFSHAHAFRFCSHRLCDRPFYRGHEPPRPLVLSLVDPRRLRLTREWASSTTGTPRWPRAPWAGGSSSTAPVTYVAELPAPARRHTLPHAHPRPR